MAELFSFSKSSRPKTERCLELVPEQGSNYEINSRFQTIDELTNRLNEILKPGATEIIEDLEIVLVRESAALRKSDRKTQLAEYIAHIQPLQQSYQMCCQEISSRLSRHKHFILGWHGLPTQLIENSKQGDVIARAISWVQVQNHPIMFQIRHTFIAQGSECTVYREIYEGQLHAQIKTHDPDEVVLRYQGDTTPNAPALIADFKAAVTKAVTLISRRIQSGT